MQPRRIQAAAIAKILNRSSWLSISECIMTPSSHLELYFRSLKRHLRTPIGGARLAGVGRGLQIHCGAVIPSRAGSIPVHLRHQTQPPINLLRP